MLLEKVMSKSQLCLLSSAQNTVVQNQKWNFKLTRQIQNLHMSYKLYLFVEVVRLNAVVAVAPASSPEFPARDGWISKKKSWRKFFLLLQAWETFYADRLYFSCTLGREAVLFEDSRKE